MTKFPNTKELIEIKKSTNIKVIGEKNGKKDGLEFDQNGKLKNAIIVDMFEIAFIDPKIYCDKKFLISINACECLIVCVRDKETGLTAMAHIPSKMTYEYDQDSSKPKDIKFKIKNPEEVLTKIFSKFQNIFSDKKRNLELHLHGTLSFKTFNQFFIFTNLLFEKYFNFEVKSCFFNLSNDPNDNILNYIDSMENDKIIFNKNVEEYMRKKHLIFNVQTGEYYLGFKDSDLFMKIQNNLISKFINNDRRSQVMMYKISQENTEYTIIPIEYGKVFLDYDLVKTLKSMRKDNESFSEKIPENPKYLDIANFLILSFEEIILSAEYLKK